MNDAIDLLYETPQIRVSIPIIERALVFAFSAGDTNNAFERVLENSGCGATSFQPDCFAEDLFVDQLVKECVPIRVAGTKYEPCLGYLRRVLTNPPSEIRETQFRQALLRELMASAAHRREFEGLYVQLRQLRSTLSAGDYGTRVDQNVRRLDILRCLADIFRSMAESFQGATSGLGRLRERGRAITSSDEYEKLAELLEYESHLATVDIRLRLGLEGSVRGFEVVGYRENAGSRFYRSWFAELWRRFSMMMRGYRVTRYELLTQLMDQVFDAIKPHVLWLFQLLGDVEFYLAGLGFADQARLAQLEPSFPELVSDEHAALELEGLYNPFLLAQGVSVHPCDVKAPPRAMVILTGPNSGGKTRLLQSVALAQLLGQAGLMVPARRAKLSWTNGMFVSLLDDVRADQEEGRLGMELLRIRRLFERINVGDMVVIDELCSGTNPSEGEEIFRLVIGLLGQLQPTLWLTTHFLKFAQRLQETESVPNLTFLKVRLDANETPTFEFEPGVAKTSLAKQTAARLGVTLDELTMLVERAKARSQRPRVSRSEAPAADLSTPPTSGTLTTERSAERADLN